MSRGHFSLVLVGYLVRSSAVPGHVRHAGLHVCGELRSPLVRDREHPGRTRHIDLISADATELADRSAAGRQSCACGDAPRRWVIQRRWCRDRNQRWCSGRRRFGGFQKTAREKRDSHGAKREHYAAADPPGRMHTPTWGQDCRPDVVVSREVDRPCLPHVGLGRQDRGEFLELVMVAAVLLGQPEFDVHVFSVPGQSSAVD